MAARCHVDGVDILLVAVDDLVGRIPCRSRLRLSSLGDGDGFDAVCPFEGYGGTPGSGRCILGGADDDASLPVRYGQPFSRRDKDQIIAVCRDTDVLDHLRLVGYRRV